MNTAVMYSSMSDEWATPQDFFDGLDVEFSFDIDAAANRENAKAPFWLDRYDDALTTDWIAFAKKKYTDVLFPTVWLNPPYSRCREFIAKAAAEARNGCTVVCLVPSRTDTKWWHDYVWDAEQHRTRPDVDVRFIRGRIKFGKATSGAPFPSVLVIFRPAAGASHV